MTSNESQLQQLWAHSYDCWPLPRRRPLYLAPSPTDAIVLESPIPPDIINAGTEIYGLTAWNPLGQTAPDEENRSQNSELQAALDGLLKKTVVSCGGDACDSGRSSSGASNDGGSGTTSNGISSFSGGGGNSSSGSGDGNSSSGGAGTGMLWWCTSFGFSAAWREDGFLVAFPRGRGDAIVAALARRCRQGGVHKYVMDDQGRLMRYTVPILLSNVDAAVQMVLIEQPPFDLAEP